MGFDAFHNFVHSHSDATETDIFNSVAETNAVIVALDVPALLPPYLHPLALSDDARVKTTATTIARGMLENATDPIFRAPHDTAALVAACDRHPKPAFKLRHARRKEYAFPEGFDAYRLPHDVPVVAPSDDARLINHGRPVLQQPGPHDSLVDWVLHPGLAWPNDTLAAAGTLWDLAVAAPVVRNLITRAIMCAMLAILSKTGEATRAPGKPWQQTEDEQDRMYAHVFNACALVTIPEMRRSPPPPQPPVDGGESPPKKPKSPQPTPDKPPAECIADMSEAMHQSLKDAPPIAVEEGECPHPDGNGTVGRLGKTPIYVEDDALFRGEADVACPRLAKLAHDICLPRDTPATIIIRTTDTDAVVSSVLQACVYGEEWPAHRFVQMRRRGGVWVTKHIRVTPGNAARACSWALAAAMLGTDYTAKSACSSTKRRNNKTFLGDAARFLQRDLKCFPLTPKYHPVSNLRTIAFNQGVAARLLAFAKQHKNDAKTGPFTASAETHARHAFHVLEYYAAIPHAAVGVRIAGQDPQRDDPTPPDDPQRSRPASAPATLPGAPPTPP